MLFCQLSNEVARRHCEERFATKQSRPNERSGARDRFASLAMTIRDDGSIRSIGKSISFTLVYWRFRGKLCKD